MDKRAHFTERLALAVARRFYNYGFDGIRDKEVRAYLLSAHALVESTVPVADWKHELARSVQKRLKKLTKRPAIELSETELEECAHLQNWDNEWRDTERKKRLRIVEARANEPRLVEQFERERGFGGGAKKQKTK